MTTRTETSRAKTIVKRWLSENGFTNRVTAKTVDFTDLARTSMVFVQVHDWKPDAKWDALKAVARVSGFRVEAK